MYYYQYHSASYANRCNSRTKLTQAHPSDPRRKLERSLQQYIPRLLPLRQYGLIRAACVFCGDSLTVRHITLNDQHEGAGSVVRD